jgi:hypothetical protein
MTTIDSIFQGLGLQEWWAKPTQYFGQSGEEGTDYSLGGTGQPVGAISGGQVIYVGDPYANDPNHSSLGYVVQVLGNDGYLYHYQHLESPSVNVGDSVGPGSVVGVSGGCPVGAYASNGQCTRTDAWSTGPHIEVRLAKYNPNGGVWNQAWQNPYTTFLNMGGGPGSSAPVVNGSSASTTSSTSSSGSLAGFGQRVGIFLGALILFGFGAFLLFKPQIEGAMKKGVEVGA